MPSQKRTLRREATKEFIDTACWEESCISGYIKNYRLIPGIRNMKENPLYEKRLDYLDPDANQTFYFTYFLTALLFSILTSVFLLLIFDSGPFFKLSEPQKIFTPAFLILFIGLTNFVITPYDNLSYFLLTLAIFSFLKYL